MSRVANNPINIPDAVNVSINDNVVVVKGNKGELDFSLPSSISIDIKDNIIAVNYNSEDQKSVALAGTTRSILNNMRNSRAVVPKIQIQDAIKQIIDSSKEEYIVGKKRDNVFLTQTPQSFNLKEIYHLHKTNSGKYKDDDISLYMDLNKVKFLKGEKNNFKITDQYDFENLKNIYKSKQSVGIGFDVHRLVPRKKLI